jgi:hypothetical protein
MRQAPSLHTDVQKVANWQYTVRVKDYRTEMQLTEQRRLEDKQRQYKPMQ